MLCVHDLLLQSLTCAPCHRRPDPAATTSLQSGITMTRPRNASGSCMEAVKAMPIGLRLPNSARKSASCVGEEVVDVFALILAIALVETLQKLCVL